MGLVELQCIKNDSMAQVFTIGKHVLLDNLDHLRTDLQCYTISKVDALILPQSA